MGRGGKQVERGRVWGGGVRCGRAGVRPPEQDQAVPSCAELSWPGIWDRPCIILP